MLEVNMAPAGSIPESKLSNTIFNVTWNDGSTGQYQLEDILRCDLYELSSVFTWPSHGMTAFEFVHWYHQNNPESIVAEGKTVKMAVYFYRKMIKLT